MTRTTRPGYLRDIRRLTVALSRARLGLYILGRRDVFENCYELKSAFDILLQRPDKLTLVTGELFPTSRLITSVPVEAEVADEANAATAKGKSKKGKSKKAKATEAAELQKEAEAKAEDGVVSGEFVMEGVEHLGQYVFEMTQTRVQQLREERGLSAIAEIEESKAVDGDDVAPKDPEEDMEGDQEMADVDS